MSIVKMRRLRLIGMQAERGALLKLLQHMGCVEIDEPPQAKDDPVWASLTRPDGEGLNRSRDQRDRLEGALKTLKKYGPRQKGGLLKPRPVITEAQLFDEGAYEAALAAAGQLGELERRITALYAGQNKLRTQRLSLAPWLELDIPLETASTEEVAVAMVPICLMFLLFQLATRRFKRMQLLRIVSGLIYTYLGLVLFLTGVNNAVLNYGTEHEILLDHLTVSDAGRYASEGQFKAGSMLPKIEASIDFIEAGKGRKAIITSMEKAKDSLAGKAGTTIE